MWFVIVGQRLCLADKEHISGCGTYERNGYIYSTLAGVVNVVKEERVFLTWLVFISFNHFYYFIVFHYNDQLLYMESINMSNIINNDL
jgi:hypothetical protein